MIATNRTNRFPTSLRAAYRLRNETYDRMMFLKSTGCVEPMALIEGTRLWLVADKLCRILRFRKSTVLLN